MDLTLSFTFKQSTHMCDVFIDINDYPCYIFILLHSKNLTQEFGEEITIKTDCEQVLPRRDDTPPLVALRKAIFDAIKSTTDLNGIKRKLQMLQKEKRRGRYV